MFAFLTFSAFSSFISISILSVWLWFWCYVLEFVWKWHLGCSWLILRPPILLPRTPLFWSIFGLYFPFGLQHSGEFSGFSLLILVWLEASKWMCRSDWCCSLPLLILSWFCFVLLTSCVNTEGWTFNWARMPCFLLPLISLSTFGYYFWVLMLCYKCLGFFCFSLEDASIGFIWRAWLVQVIRWNLTKLDCFCLVYFSVFNFSFLQFCS